MELLTCQQLAERREEFTVLDVREDYEVELGMIPQAIHIPMQQVPERLHELQHDGHYAVICKAGVRSEMVARYLEEQGFTVYNVIDGMLGWDGELV